MISQHPSEDVLSIVPKLAHSGIALIEFAEALSGSKVWERGANYRWIIQPKKFVALQGQRRLKGIRFTVRGRPPEFAPFGELKLETGRGGSYSGFVFNETRHLAAAAFYISRAYELYQRGGSRRPHRQAIQEM